MDNEKLAISETLSGKPPEPGCEMLGAPAPIDPATGMHRDYWVLSADERSKGFVRPVRTKYRHVGIAGPTHPLRDLSEEERERYAQFGYAKFEAYPNREPFTGRFWTEAQLAKVGKGCGSETRMGLALAETFARNPQYYGGTFCAACRAHFSVGEGGEFIWDDGARVGS